MPAVLHQVGLVLLQALLIIWFLRSAPDLPLTLQHLYGIAVHGSAGRPILRLESRAIGNSPRAREDISGGASTGFSGTGLLRFPQSTTGRLRRSPSASQRARPLSVHRHHQVPVATGRWPLPPALFSPGSPQTRFQGQEPGGPLLFSLGLPKTKANRACACRVRV